MPSKRQPRIAPLQDGDMDADQQRLVASYRRGDYLANVIRVFASHTPLFTAYKPFGVFTMRGSSLPPTLRELAILRIGVLNSCDYEWAHHVEIARNCGMSDTCIERVKHGSDAEGWAEAERAVLVATETLHAAADLPGAIFEALLAHLSLDQVFELVATVGNYVMITMILNSFAVPLEPGYHGLDAAPGPTG